MQVQRRHRMFYLGRPTVLYITVMLINH